MNKPAPNHWLMKSEPSEVSIDDVLGMPQQTVPWFGVRNYQARNFMRDGMRVGDAVLFYHSSCPEPGIAGLARVASAAKPDETQFDKKSKYYDASAKPPKRPASSACRNCVPRRNWPTCGSCSAATGCRSRRSKKPNGISSSRS
jgi:predicted RNA-binding protein with PUA-like domain